MLWRIEACSANLQLPTSNLLPVNQGGIAGSAKSCHPDHNEDGNNVWQQSLPHRYRKYRGPVYSLESAKEFARFSAGIQKGSKSWARCHSFLCFERAAGGNGSTTPGAEISNLGMAGTRVCGCARIVGFALGTTGPGCCRENVKWRIRQHANAKCANVKGGEQAETS